MRVCVRPSQHSFSVRNSDFNLVGSNKTQMCIPDFFGGTLELIDGILHHVGSFMLEKEGVGGGGGGGGRGRGRGEGGEGGGGEGGDGREERVMLPVIIQS